MTDTKSSLILLLAAQPEGTHSIKLDEEARGIRLKLREADGRDEIRLESYWATRPDDVMQALSQYRPDVVHFSGHGTASSELILASSLGGPQKVTEKAMVSLFRTMGQSIKAVVLNSCFSASQAKEISNYVDIAIGMREGIAVDSAILFSESFYRGLGYRKSFLDSFEEGKLALELHGVPGDHIPVLFSRSEVDARDVFLLTAELPALKKEDLVTIASLISRIPLGPILHVHHVPRPIIEGFGEMLDTSEKFDCALGQATAVLCADLPEGYTERQMLIRRGQLPSFGAMPIDAFWAQVFSVAGLKSRRTVASLLATPIGHWALDRSGAASIASSFLKALQDPSSFSQ